MCAWVCACVCVFNEVESKTIQVETKVNKTLHPAKFVPVFEEERALISKLRYLNRRVSRGNKFGRSVRVKNLELFY